MTEPKYCRYCEQTRTVNDFPKGRNKCKICRNKDGKKSYDKNHKKKPVPPSPDVKICSIKGCGKIKPIDEFIKERNICKECKSKISRKNYLKDVEKHLENLDQIKECIECKKKKSLEYFAVSKNMCIKCKTKYFTERLKNNPEFKIRCNLSSRINSALKSQNTKKQHKTMVLTGCSPYELKQWLKHQFDSDMTQENHGSYWHIDHVIPCASFNLMKEEEQLKCFNWKNLRPCEGKENISKGDKIDIWQILLQEIRVDYYRKLTELT